MFDIINFGSYEGSAILINFEINLRVDFTENRHKWTDPIKF